MQNKTLYFGDNLEILRKKIPDESFDLIYLDPPFNSSRSYNVLFQEGLRDSEAQVRAFEDSWHWTRESKQTFDYLVTKTNEGISNLMLALEKVIGHNDMLAYLAMMTARLIELHRVLKKTGSLYLHCDPTASHYLKIVLDAVFGKEHFRNEIIWKRQTAKKGSQFKKRTYGNSFDSILFYTKTDEYQFKIPLIQLTENELEQKFNKIDEQGRRYRLDRVTLPRMMARQNLRYEYKGYTPEYGWMMEKGKLRKLDEEGRLYWSKDGKAYRKYFMDSYEGQEVSNVWTDIFVASGDESLKYPTQKPLALLERIIQASSNEGDWILDSFCGCGTTVVAAEKLNRHWVGIDITALAINLIKHRLKKQFDLGTKQINLDGLPNDVNGARELFKKDPFEFEYWALDLINAMPAQSKSQGQMRGADRGVDGVVTFIKNTTDGNGKNGNGNGKWEYGKAIVQVKGGGAQRSHIATLKGDIEREKAEAGIFITLEKPTQPMIKEAVDAGIFTTPITNKAEFPKIQILTVDELLSGHKPNLPQGLIKNYYKEAKSIEKKNNSMTQKMMMF